MGLLQLSSIHHYFTALFHQLMSQPPPTDVPGLFILYRGYEVDTRGWRDMLRNNASSCKLECIEFCKEKNDKLHEFLVLYFSHHTQTPARAAVVVDRAVKDPSNSFAIVSPSLPFQKATPALDRVYVVGQNLDLDAYLSHTYGEYNKLCALEYPLSDLSSSMPPPPSAIQLSILLLVVTEHQPDYNLYEHNCYWFANTVFEASKKLFPGHRERYYKRDDRGRCRLSLPILAPRDLPNICKEYDAACRRMSRDVIDQPELERRLEEECRTREAAESAYEEERRTREAAESACEEERRTREAAESACEEERRTREAAERHCKQLQAQLQAVRQAQLRMPVK